MRRVCRRVSRRSRLSPLVAVLAAVSVSSVACSGGDGVDVTVRGDFGKLPEVRFPKGGPSGSLAVETLRQGKGAAARKGDLVVADYVGYRWGDDGRKLLASSYAQGQPGAFPTGQLVPGLTRALDGARPGSRVVARIPPRDGFGEKGDPKHQVGADDTLVYVLDVRAVYARTSGPHGRREAPLDDPALPKVGDAPAGKAPSVTVPRAVPPKRLQVRTLTRGDGPPVRKGQLLALQYGGFFWRDGRAFDSSWSAGHPYGVVIGTGQVIRGWDQGLVGQRVGSRVLLVVPPSLGYGPKGLAQSGIKGTDTLVFVVDLLGAH
ncbi:FKBP-type peptidyl-prolyl cis-trans isomerase [Actinomadura decatromicini]|uniref:Peptidyl-prolyl cis-trans isomerase n=1 Tax=Actinomadura decatromicini TaxID=2604572 RepID=A0A5D3FAD7_9ACTN|nr:FKBP-type peptidyl-prolyl cis-trans isomerase [Actinomadura decatromicini]